MVWDALMVSAEIPSCSDYSLKGKGLLALAVPESQRPPTLDLRGCSEDDILQGELPHVTEDTSVFSQPSTGGQMLARTETNSFGSVR